MNHDDDSEDQQDEFTFTTYFRLKIKEYFYIHCVYFYRKKQQGVFGFIGHFFGEKKKKQPKPKPPPRPSPLSRSADAQQSETPVIFLLCRLCEEGLHILF